MKIAVKTLEGDSVGDIELADEVFGAPVRSDILRAASSGSCKRRAGTHKTKGISEITATTKKPYNQKGTGRARQGNEAAPQFRGGGRRSARSCAAMHSTCRRRCASSRCTTALSAKAAEGKLIVIDAAALGRAQDGAARASSASSACRRS